MSKLRKLYVTDIVKEYEYLNGKNHADDFIKTYYYGKIVDVIHSGDFYIKDDVEVESKFGYRLTYPLYIIFILLMFIVKPIKWIFTGKSFYVSNNKKLYNFLNRWQRLGGFI